MRHSLATGCLSWSSSVQCRKFTVDNKTETQMTALSQAERVPALARLLGGSEITELALANAQEMLDLVH